MYEVLERAFSALVHVVSAVGVDVQRKANKASRVAKGQELEVEHLVEVTEIDPEQARTLRKHGADWPKLKDEAEALKKED
ncbi:hypothetical protein [Mesorhizobium sp. M7A.F.Ce.TU.012.03.2.1]|uniref:hypothetical protein n=1 Tax=Mesorhizobium sp. M7A.F.Ce.TU.012.03.2.1 TaxID=2493681 RepID=UPI0013E3C84A|nr:hypothetical protein [Mesorhizobium sp. M7A.F.Ce.TU.012.03.2.1]